MAGRKIGRPKKVGKFKYYIKTGGAFGNIGQSQPHLAKTIVKDTDTETKRAAQKFFRAFQAPNRMALCTSVEVAALTSLLQELDGLHEAQSAWEHDSFEAGPLYYEWRCAWGDSGGDFVAACEITRAKATGDNKQGGLL
jgi:hypothetical protein